MSVLVIDKDIKNAKQWAKTYSVKFIEPGLVNYDDAKMGTLLLKKETIDKIIPTFIDKPVVINHKKVTPSNFEDIAVGYIKNVYFNSIDGWFYADILIHNEDAHEKISDGCGVSCAYTVNNIIQGGMYHNIEYDGEISDGIGEHLALVDNPRYEECLMAINGKNAYLYNEKKFQDRISSGKSNKQEDSIMLFNFFGKKDDKGFKPDTMVDVGNGKKVALKDLIALQNSIEDKHEIDGSVEIELANGKKVTLESMVNSWKAANEKTDEGEEKDEEKNKEEAEGKNAKNNKKMKNCGCGAKNGAAHEKGCDMYNADAVEKEEEKEKDMANDKYETLMNAVADLKKENEVLKNSLKNTGVFVKINEARNKGGDDIGLENGTIHSNSLEDKLARGRKYFEVKK